MAYEPGHYRAVILAPFTDQHPSWTEQFEYSSRWSGEHPPQSREQWEDVKYSIITALIETPRIVSVDRLDKLKYISLIEQVADCHSWEQLKACLEGIIALYLAHDVIYNGTH